MQGLIIGYGSIGKRHAEVLKSLECQVCLVTSQKVNDYICYSSIEDALKNESIDYVIIANPTYLHHDTLLNLIECDYQGIVLIEKPLFSKIENLPKNNIAKILIAYNLRFHELLLQAKKIIENAKLITFSAYVGQYLPTWRKERDYRHCYSAKKEQGGGVLRDLSHELDYCLWLCGPCIDVTAIGGKFSNLEINSEDAYSIMMKCDLCPIVNLHLNYLDRSTRREITINTQQDTIFIDFIKGVLSINGEIHTRYSDGMSQTYIQQHKAAINKDFDSFCSYSEGLSVMKLIEAIESASASQAWVNV